MKNVNLRDDVVLIGREKRNSDSRKMIDYYVCIEDEEIYAFTKTYRRGTFDLCRRGIQVNKLMHMRSRDTGVMLLVDHAKRMIPFLAEYYELPLAE